jgi:hypothetical protein
MSFVRSNGADLAFELTLTVSGQLASGVPRYLGSLVHGPANERFVYLRIGTMAGDAESCWTRRAKIHLSEITWAMVEQARTSPGSVILGRFGGTAKDGGPSCASLRVLEAGWEVATNHGATTNGERSTNVVTLVGANDEANAPR